MSRFLQEDCGVRKESLWNMRPQVGVITELLPDCDMGVLVDLALAGEKRFGEGLELGLKFESEELQVPR
jgi:hypothetical protein